MSLFLSVLFLCFILSFTQSEFVSTPVTAEWTQYTNTTLHPSIETFYEITIFDNTTLHIVHSGLCLDLEYDEDNVAYCTPMEYSCIDVRVSEVACPLENATQSNYLRDCLLSTIVKTDEFGYFNITEELDYPLSQNARSIRFYELDGELLLCNDFTWTERRSTDGASTSKITILLTLMVLFILFA